MNYEYEEVDLFGQTKIRSTDWKWSLKDYPSKNGLNVFSCFACGGGSTMGYKLCGCNVIGCLEIDPKMIEVYKANHHPQYAFNMDIREFNNIPNEQLPGELFDLDILDGSPPCTTFSMAGQREDSWGKKKKFREGQAEQTLDDLSFVFIDTVAKLMPKVVIMENVEGLLKGNAWAYVQKINEKFEQIGYDVEHWLIKGEEIGLPQTRHRVFFVAARKELKANLKYLDMLFNYEPIPFGKVKDTVFIKPSAKVTELIQKAVPNKDQSLRDVLLRHEGRRSGFNEMIVWDDLVSPTVHAHGFFRACDASKFTDLDYIHCGTFPEDYNGCGQAVSYIVGMSVPPVMMKRVAGRVIEHIWGKDQMKGTWQ